MTSGLVVGLVVVVVLVVVAAFVAAGETALTRISRARAEGLAAEGLPGAASLVAVLDDRQDSLAPLLLVRLACHVGVVAVVVTVVADRTTSAWIAVWATVAVLLLYLVAEALPRSWALLHPDLAARRAAPPLRALLRVAPLRWLTRGLNGVANVLLPGPARPPVVSEDELIALTEAAAAGDAIDDEERDLIESVFALGDTIVREIMVPRTDMTTADADATVTEVMDLAGEKGFSRLPVCGDGIDDIIGVCLVKDLSRAERAGGGDRHVKTLLRPPRFVPETKHADDLLREMQAGQHHLAVVIDEYGGTAGLVTLEDLVEELVGEIVDEYDNEEPLLEPLAGGEVLVHGRMPVDQLNGLVDATLSEGDWDTVGGLIFNTLGHVPEIGESVENGGVFLRVEQVEGRRITRVRLTRPGDGGRSDG